MHQLHLRRVGRFAALALAATLAAGCASSPASVERPAPAPAPTPTPAPDTQTLRQQQPAQALPAARTLVQRHLQAMGGREALLAPSSIRSRGRFEVPAAGISGELEMLQMAPNRVITRITIPNMGVMQQGFDGQHGWSSDPMTGARLAGEGELRTMRDQAEWTASVRDERHLTSMETLERTEMGGRACYMVRLVWRSGRETRDCYGVDDGRLVGMIMTQESPMGATEVRTVVEDYGRFGVVSYPTRIRQSAMGLEQILHLDSVEFNTVTESDMRPPPDVRTLIEQRRAGGTEN